MLGGQGGFNFTTPAASSTGQTGFSFGAPSTAGASTSNPGFSFGAPAATTTAAATGNATAGGFSFGSTPSTGGGFAGFGGLGTSTAATTAASSGLSGFNFGATAAKPSSTAATTTAAAPLATGFGLGATTAAAAPGGAGGGFSFGGAGGATGFTGLGGNLSGNAKTSAPGLATTSLPAATAAPGLSFNIAAPKSTAAAAPASSLSSLLNQASTQPATLPAAGTTSAPSGFSLGVSSAASTAPTAPGFSFNTSLAPPAATATTASTSLPGGFNIAGLASSTAATTASTTAATSLTSGQKQMTFRQLEDTINKWTTELEEQEKCFLDQATQVNAWDRIVMENGEKIIQLNKDLERVKLDQQKLDHELDFVRGQQRELEEMLSPLEKALEELPPISHSQHAQLEREHTYTLAESLDSQLKRMSQDLKEIVERLNSTNNKSDDNNPLQQITKILNSHVVSLMWVDRNSANLQRRAEEIAKMMDLEKKEQERNFRMAYS